MVTQVSGGLALNVKFGSVQLQQVWARGQIVR